jgi:hypothetical protein
MHDTTEIVRLMPANAPTLPPDAAFIEAQLAQARQNVRRARADLRYALRSVVSPRRMFRHHPLGVSLTVGAFVALGTVSLASPRGRTFTRGILQDLAGLLRRPFVTRLLPAVLVWAFAPVSEPPCFVAPSDVGACG